MKVKLLILPLLLMATNILAADFYVFSRIAGGTMVGCRNKVKNATTLKEADKQKNLESICGKAKEKKGDYVFYECSKIQSKMWIVKGKDKCESMKSNIAATMKPKDNLYGFFAKDRKLWGGCASVIGFEGLRGATQALAPSCGKPLRTDNKSYAIFKCNKAHGNRQEFYFVDQARCKDVLLGLQKSMRRK